MAEQHPDKVELTAVHRNTAGARHLVEDRNHILDQEVITSVDVEKRLIALRDDVAGTVDKDVRDEILLLRELVSALTGDILSTPEDSDWIRTWSESVEILISNIKKNNKRLVRIPVVQSSTRKRSDVILLNDEAWLVE